MLFVFDWVFQQFLARFYAHALGPIILQITNIIYKPHSIKHDASQKADVFASDLPKLINSLHQKLLLVLACRLILYNLLAFSKAYLSYLRQFVLVTNSK